jgi:DNA polymerase V
MSDVTLVRDDYHPDPEADGVAVHSGFPNPGADRRTAPLSLDRLLIRHPSSTYFFRVQGHAWAEHGIFDGNLALIDRAVTPGPQDLVIYWEGNDFAISRRSRLTTTEPIWGTIINTIHEHHVSRRA